MFTATISKDSNLSVRACHDDLYLLHLLYSKLQVLGLFRSKKGLLLSIVVSQVSI